MTAVTRLASVNWPEGYYVKIALNLASQESHHDESH